MLLISTRNEPVDVVRGLRAGADDHVTEPFDGPLRVARVRSPLRRAARAEQPERSPRPRFEDLECLPASLTPHRGGKPLAPTTTERKLLRELAAAQGTARSRDLPLQRVRDHAWSGDTPVLDVRVQRLRAKTGRERVATVHGLGCKLRP